MTQLKQSEARLLVYLEKTDVEMRWATAISLKLDIGYQFTLEILNKMVYKKWLRVELSGRKKYYFLTKKAPLEEAKEALLNVKK